ncbi:MAG: Gfo/Idh/MocA family oxidoreductase [Dehalococcoidia bacterium]|nr:Gfo/Idh/MocA family oxidoreductase [Dehalococcoidia bacterium]MYD52363.1 Gfo/Idh/MocA family oxidoreductase [Dehalococcoidia bacterium]
MRPTQKYRAGVIGLGWMGMLADVAVVYERGAYSVDDVERPTPELDVHREFHYHQNVGGANIPHTWAEVFHDRPDVELVAGAERDPQRLKAFGERYGVDALYTDAEEMLHNESLDIVAVATNVKGRADLTCLAVECGAKAIAIEKPIAHTLHEVDRIVIACAAAGVPLVAGATPANHPSYGRAKELISDGATGDVVSIEAEAPASQKPHWMYFVDDMPLWVVGVGDRERRDSGSDEFVGQGLAQTRGEAVVHFRKGAGLVRVSGTSGEIVLDSNPGSHWRLWQDVDIGTGVRRVEIPWPAPQFEGGYNAVCGLSDLIDCLEGRLVEPKNSGRRAAIALEVEIALKQSAANGAARVDLPLKDRSLGLNYDWFR